MFGAICDTEVVPVANKALEGWFRSFQQAGAGGPYLDLIPGRQRKEVSHNLSGHKWHILMYIPTREGGHMQRTAKIFMNNRSQAVRLPRSSS